MADRFAISSDADESTFELSNADADSWRAVLTGRGLRAEGTVYAYQPHGTLARFFVELAASWRGWSGERTWESLEHEMKLCATHDGHGHVLLRVELWPGGTASEWCARGALTIEPGHLDALKAAALAFLDA